MVIADIDDALKLAKARLRPNLSFLPFSPHAMLEQIRSEHFGQLPHRVELHFVSQGPLACLCHEENTAEIYIHQVLNHSETPEDVIQLICKHELLHLVIPPSIIGQKEVQHPPEFWEAEQRLRPREDGHGVGFGQICGGV